LITVDIAGYTFDDMNKCIDCAESWVVAGLVKEGHDRHTLETAYTVEELFNLYAGYVGIDRAYADSNDFPVPFSCEQAQTDASWATHDSDNPPRCTCGNDFMGEF